MMPKTKSTRLLKGSVEVTVSKLCREHNIMTGDCAVCIFIKEKDTEISELKSQVEQVEQLEKRQDGLDKQLLDLGRKSVLLLEQNEQGLEIIRVLIEVLDKSRQTFVFLIDLYKGESPNMVSIPAREIVKRIDEAKAHLDKVGGKADE